MNKILLLIITTIIFFSCQNENLIVREEPLSLSRSNEDFLIFNPVPLEWTFRVLYKRFVKNEFNVNPTYQNLVAFDEYSESMLLANGHTWFESTPLLKLFAYQVFHANGGEPIAMGFDTSLRLDEKEGGVYHLEWGIYFLQAGPGPNFVSRSVFNHELTHIFQHKICKYTMNVDTEDVIEFEADIITDALELVCNKGAFPVDSELFALKDLSSQAKEVLRQQYLNELVILVETAGRNSQIVNEFYSKWYKLVYEKEPKESFQAKALLCITSWKHSV